jgi:hypothetical protein
MKLRTLRVARTIEDCGTSPLPYLASPESRPQEPDGSIQEAAIARWKDASPGHLTSGDSRQKILTNTATYATSSPS